jgi:ribosomal protein S27AE
MQRKRVLERRNLSEPPRVCPKPNCGGTHFVYHEDGWQCWNCMKIIYRDQPLVFYLPKQQDDYA